MDGVYAALAVQILLLVAGGFLYHQARSDLTARAAQMPALTEVRALEQTIASMLEQLRLETVQTTAQLEARSREARDLIAVLDRRIEEIRQPGPARPAGSRRAAPAQAAPEPAASEEAAPEPPEPPADAPAAEEPPAQTAAAQSADPPLTLVDAQTGGGGGMVSQDVRIKAICTLADRGVGVPEIARATGASESEVELVLEVRGRGAGG